MLHLIYGKAGSGKSTRVRDLIKMRLQNAPDGQILLIVPEQQVLETERKLIEGGVNSLSVSVYSFRRLANGIFRALGGLSTHYIGKGAETVLLFRTLCELGDTLKTYNRVSVRDLSALQLIGHTIKELKQAGATPMSLLDASAKLSDTDKPLSEKLSDLSMVMSTREAIIAGRFEDPQDDLSRALSRLQKARLSGRKPFFSEYTIFFDSFDGFTEPELSLISEMLFEGAEVFASLGYIRNERISAHGCFDKLRSTDHALRKRAAIAGTTVSEERLTGVYGRDPAISYLIDHFLDDEADPYPEKTDVVRVIGCKSAFEEARTAAADILKKVGEGASFSDFAIVLHDPKDYDGILDSVFSSYGIPLQISARTDIRRHALIRMILSVLKIGSADWREEDVIAYLRTGFSGISSDDADLLEEYVSLWHISGQKWLRPWTKHPDGFGAPVSDDSRTLLAKLNELRERLTAPLCAFFGIFAGKEVTIRDFAKGLYDFLIAIDAKKQLLSEAAENAQNGRILLAAEEKQLFPLLFGILDDLVAVAGEVCVDLHAAEGLFNAVSQGTDIGTIPERLDQVTCGSAFLLRRSDISHVYLFGVNDGVFPSKPTEDPILSERERRALKELGIEALESSEDRISNELYSFFRALSMPGKSLTITYRQNKAPSEQLHTIMRLLHIEAASAAESGADEIYTRRQAKEFSARDKTGLYREFFGDELYFDNAGLALSAENEALDSFRAASYFSNPIVLSHSLLESYAECPQAFFCKYMLKLRTTGSDRIRPNTLGTLIHDLLERFFRALGARRLKDLSEDEARELMKTVIAAHRAEYEIDRQDARVIALYDRMGRLMLLLASSLYRELSASDFVPRYFELYVGDRSRRENGAGSPAIQSPSIPLPDGTEVKITGRVDRVDVWECGENAYVRIEDYKTSFKKFDPEKLENGLDLQMPLYLMALCEDENMRRKHAPDGNLLPGGAVYCIAAYPDSKNLKTAPTDPDATYEWAVETVRRNGIYNRDEAVRRAMENTERRFVQIGKQEDNLYSEEDFRALEECVRSVVSEKAQDMKKGMIHADPLRDKETDACRYCEMYEICRKKEDVRE